MKYMLDTNICIYVQKNKNPNVLKKFKENFSQLGIIRAKLEKSGNRIGDNDMLIAANAKAENAILVTNNVREFERVDGLVVENWGL